MALLLAPVTHNFAAARAALDAPASPVKPARRTVWLTAVQDLAARTSNPTSAVAGLVGLDASGSAARITIALLGSLGANQAALDLAERRALADDNRARASLFLPSLTRVRAGPGFVNVAERVGLMRYWRTTKTRPDECRTAAEPTYCRAI